MKRFWLVLLSLGLIVAFSTSAMAVDVKFAGEYYAAGMYMDKTSMVKQNTNGNPSTAFYYQRLRVGAEFVVSPGIKLITRADIMERAWGAERSAVGGHVDTMSMGTRAENENIAFDLAYVSWVSPFGLFNVGYQIDQAWGTVFGDSSQPAAKLVYAIPIGNFTASLQTGKIGFNAALQTATPLGGGLALTNRGWQYGEHSAGAFAGNTFNASDRDNNFYTAAARYAWKTGDAGLLFRYNRMASARGNYLSIDAGAVNLAGAGAKGDQYYVIPYAKAKLGPVALQAEVTYSFGKVKFEDKYVNPGAPAAVAAMVNGLKDVDISAWSAWVDATADFGMFYVGLTGAHVSGDDSGTDDKNEGALTGGLDWNPCLMMFNQDRSYWFGALNGYGTSTNASAMTNAWFGSFRAGVRPVEKLDIMLSASYAKADKTPAHAWNANWDSREYGTEVDLTATYKITNNLSYMLGGGYWFVGNYYKATTTANNDLSANYMIINKLTLTF